MKNILKKYCNIQCENGLLLLSMPTGFGKTYQVLKFIYENYKQFADKERKILFVTSLKKNLPLEDFKKRFIDDGKEHEFDQYVLFIDSNFESVKNRLLSVDHIIPEQFKASTFYKLKSYIETVQKNTAISKTVRSSLEAEIIKQLEPAFRKSIIDVLYKNYKTKKERLAAIRNNPEYQWIGELYPAVFTDERTILFLSMDKFLVKNTTLIESSYYFYERLIDKALIFIDEVDATKDIVLTNIIDSGLRHRVNLLGLFLNIHNHLMQSEYPETLLKESRWRKEQRETGGKKRLPLQQIVDTFQKKAKQIFEDFNLQHTCKSHEDFSTVKRNFLFYDYQFHHVLDARHKNIEIVTDIRNRANWIKAVDRKVRKPGKDIRSLLRKIAGFLIYFQNGIRYLADNYSHLKQENDAVRDLFPRESAIRTVLNHFRLDAEDVEFLTTNIMEGELPYSLRTEKSIFQRQGFYDTGFRYYDIVDSDEHDTLSKIYMYNFSRTPEAFLVDVCSKAMVVGISATAGLHTSIGNYDIKYLQAQLGDSYFQLTGEMIDKLKVDLERSTQGYNNILIHPQFIGSDLHERAIETLEDLLNDEEAAKSLINEIRHTSDQDESTIQYAFCRYIRALIAWKYFSEHPDCHAFLCLFNKLPKDGDPLFDISVLRKYAKLLLDDNVNSIDDDITNIIVVLSGDQFEENKANLMSELAEGKRRFIISAYQTIGAGQNLQYPIPHAIDPTCINEHHPASEMDINGLYLDRLTHLIVNIYGDTFEDDKSFIKYIFQLEFLVENGAISPNEFKIKLDEAFHRYVGKKKPKRNPHDYVNLYETEAYTRFLNKMVIQAVGRICRTNMKAQVIHLLADVSIQKHLARFALPEDVIPVREYAALLESSKKSLELPDEGIEMRNLASLRSDRTMRYIRRQLNNPWTPESIADWQKLREQTLHQPAVSTTETWDATWENIYIPLPEPASSYWYSERYDYKNIEVSFSKDNGKKEVSEQAARLPELMKIKLLHDLFIESEWATCFPRSTHILTPPIFNNIYKGALGEVCGKHILQHSLGIQLSELDVEEFELFDFKADQGAYIDFKLWNDRVAVPADTLLDEIRGKMERVKASKVFIINILGTADTNFHPILSSDKRLVEVPYLCKADDVDADAMAFLVKELYV